jgi:hypothetical protein
MESSNETFFSIEQIMNDCKIIPSDAGNGKIKIKIIFPEYFDRINYDIRRYIINKIQNL